MQKVNSRLLAAFFTLLCVSSGVLRSQDFHLTQFDMAPLYFNPALTGFYYGEKADYKFYADYRTQWKAIGIKPYGTAFLSYDQPFKDRMGIGGYLIHSKNGNGGLNTFNLMPSFTYKITEENSPHQLSTGLQMGIIYRKFDPNHFTYDNQYTEDKGFDPSLSSGENFAKVSWTKFDANAGVFYRYNNTEWKAIPKGGFSVFHASQPNQTMTSFSKDKLPLRWAFSAGCDWKIDDTWSAHPTFLYMSQSKASEINIGALVDYKLKDSKNTIVGGLNYRLKDALILQAGFKYDRHIIKLSYDINTSYLNNYSNGRGGFEISMILSGQKGVKMFSPSIN